MKIDYRKFISERFMILDREKQVPVRFNFNKVQEKYYDLLQKEYSQNMDGVREIVLKARQEGMSSFILALFTVDFILRPYSVSVCISHRKDSTDVLFKKVKFYLECYLRSLAAEKGADYEELEKQFFKSNNRNLIENNVNKATFYIGTAGAKVGGRGGSARNVLFSECAFYQDTDLITAQEIVLGTAQQVPQGKGMIFIESCVVGDTLVFSEDGVVPIEKYAHPKLGFTNADKIDIYGRYGWKDTFEFYNSGVRPTKKLTTKLGLEVEGSFIHPLVALENGQIVKKKLEDIEVGDRVCVQYNQGVFGENDKIDYVPKLTKKEPSGIFGQKLTPDLAYFLGLYIAEGYARKERRSGQVIITSADEEIHNRIKDIIPLNWRRVDEYHAVLSSIELIDFMEAVGFDISLRANEKVIPEKIGECSQRVISAFLRGMFDGDGCSRSDTGYISYTSTSEALIKKLQVFLLNFGLVSRIYKHQGGGGGTIGGRKINGQAMRYQLEIDGRSSKLFYKRIGFFLDRKQKNKVLLEDIGDKDYLVYGVTDEIRKLFKKNDYSLNSMFTSGNFSNKAFFSSSGAMTQNTLKKVLKHVESDNLKELAESNYYWDKVVKMEEGEAPVYDFHVPDGHTFTSNGLISFNTANGEGNFYQETWEKAERKDSIYTPRFFGWDEFYDKEWVEEKRKEFPNDKMWKQEYPNNPEEAFITSGTPYFDTQILNEMLKKENETIEEGKFAPDGSLDRTYENADPQVKIYREIKPQEQFVVFADPADSNDFCAAVALSKKHFDMPIVFNAIMESSQFGYELNSMCKYIHKKTNMWPKLAIERNTGQATIYVLKTLNYPDLFRMVDFSSSGGSHEKGQIGWVTTGHITAGELRGTRRKMLDDLALAIKQGQMKIYDETQIKQLKGFRIVKGRAQARSNQKDDLVMACYSDDTEVLTETGWRLINEVKPGEKIHSLNPETNQVELAVNTETINAPYKGDMVHFSGRAIDFLVTPNHKMFAHKSRGQNRYTEAQVIRADELLGKHFRLHKDAHWVGEEREWWIIPEYKPSKFHKLRPEIKLKTNDFLSLLGFYIAEGSAYGDNKNGWKLLFSQQKESKGFEPFKALLDRLEIKHSYAGSDFVIHNSHLAKYFKKLVPGHAHEKRIPREILCLSLHHLQHLFDFLMLGDGSNGRHYTTSSSGLADDFEELVNRLGWTATRNTVDNRGRIIFGDRTVRHKEHYISIAKKHLRPRLNHHSKDQVSLVDYDGNQVCLSLDKNHIMLVRRNNTTMWSGNTAGSWQIHMVTPDYSFSDWDEEAWKREREKWRFK